MHVTLWVCVSPPQNKSQLSEVSSWTDFANTLKIELLEFCPVREKGMFKSCRRVKHQTLTLEYNSVFYISILQESVCSPWKDNFVIFQRNKCFMKISDIFLTRIIKEPWSAERSFGNNTWFGRLTSSF